MKKTKTAAPADIREAQRARAQGQQLQAFRPQTTEHRRVKAVRRGRRTDWSQHG